MKAFVLICIYLELITFLVSLLAYRKYSHTPLKALPIWLGSIVFVEFYCYYVLQVNNVWLHNFLNIFEFLLLSFVFWHYMNSRNKRWLYIFVAIYLTIVVIDVLLGFQNIMLEPLSYVYVTSYLLIILIVALLFHQKLKADPYEKHYNRNLLYWICFGLLLSNGTVLPLYSITNWMESLGDLRIYLLQILIFAVVIKNIIFIVGFLCCKRMYSY